MINNAVLAYICNDLENVADYKVDGDRCYYRGEYMGDMKENFNLKTGVWEIYFQPVKPVEYIEVNVTISPTGVTMSDIA